MRLPILSAGALALAACGTNGQSDNTAAGGENLTAENIVSNDVTAIDAVTGDSANMAADVNYTAELANAPVGETNAARPTRPMPRTTGPGKPPLEQPTPAQTATNNAAE